MHNPMIKHTVALSQMLKIDYSDNDQENKSWHGFIL